MSFDPFVPCNCTKNGLTNWPDFKDKLEIIDGMIDIKDKFVHDSELEKKYDAWEFCKHGQKALEMSMAQSIIGWKKHVQDHYPNQFLNFEKFIPISNDESFHDYDKQQTINEIIELKKLIDVEHHTRLDQFITLLNKAIELNQNIYW